MTTLFTGYTFKTSPAASGQTLRNLPDRLSDVINVRDHGATGDGVTDDTAAFTSAINYAWTLFTDLGSSKTVAGAIIYIPAGTYYIGSPPLILDGDRNPAVETHNGVCKFVGAGRDVTIIKGTHFTGGQPESHNNSFLVHCGTFGIKAVNGVYNLTIWNQSTGIASGAFSIGNSGNEVCVDNCRFIGSIGYIHDIQTFGHSVTNCIATCTKTITAANAATLSPLYDANNFLNPVSGITPPGRFYGTVGFALAQVFAANNVATGFDVGFSFNTLGSTVVGNKALQCGIGFMGGYTVGTPGQGEFLEDGYPSFGSPGQGVQACWVSNRAVRCTWGMYGVATVTAANVFSGDDGPYVPATISGMSWNSGSHVVTVTTASAHNLTTGDMVVIVPATWTPVVADPIATVTVTGANTFTYPGPATTPPAFTSGTWNYPREYGITGAGGNTDNIVASNVSQSPVSIASFMIPTATSERNRVMAMRGQDGWTLINPANNAAPAWLFDQCDVVPIITYAGLLEWNGYHTGMQPAMEFNVSDGSPAAAAFGAAITGGGVDTYKIRYNGTNWTRNG